MSCFVDFQLKVSFLENFFESRKADFELDTQIVSHEQRALTAGRQIVDVQKGTTKGFLYPEEMMRKIRKKTLGMLKKVIFPHEFAKIWFVYVFVWSSSFFVYCSRKPYFSILAILLEFYWLMVNIKAIVTAL